MLLDHHPLLAAVLGLAAAVTSTLLHAPQLARVLRRGDAAGLAPAAVLSGVVQHLAWNVYAWQGQAWVVLVSNAVATVVFLALAVAAARAGLRADRACWIPAAWAPVVVGSALVGYAAFGLALTVGSLLTLVPSVVSAWTSERISGLSSTTWTLTLLNGGLFWVLGATGSPFGVLAYGVVATIASALVLLAVGVRTGARSVRALEPAEAFTAAA